MNSSGNSESGLVVYLLIWVLAPTVGIFVFGIDEIGARFLAIALTILFGFLDGDRKNR
jgi:hypothetical protein